VAAAPPLLNNIDWSISRRRRDFFENEADYINFPIGKCISLSFFAPKHAPGPRNVIFGVLRTPALRAGALKTLKRCVGPLRGPRTPQNSLSVGRCAAKNRLSVGRCAAEIA